MRLLHLSLTNFRNYARLELDLPPGIIVLQGENAQGKTNLLEAMYYLSAMRSPRTNADRELVNWLALEEALPFARLVAQIEKASEPGQIELSLVQSGSNRLNPNGAVLRKHVRINGASKRVLDAVGVLNIVLFMPQDINLVAGAPGLRRRYLDDTICQLDARYCQQLQEYNRVLTQRNPLLRSLRGQADNAQLAFWDQRLAEHGAYLTVRRQEAVQQLDAFIQDIHPRLTEEKERLRLEYCASVRMESRPRAAYQIPLLSKPGAGASIETSALHVAASFASQLSEARSKELELGMSTIGPHRDELRFLVNGVDMNTYGSRGQQRTITLSLKLAEAEWVTQEKNDKPILLLDDVASELDASHRECVMSALDSAHQVVITTTGLAQYKKEFLERATLWHVSGGRVEDLTLP